MSTIDIIILICFVPALVTGILKGFISQAISLVSVILGAWLAFRFSETVCNWLSDYLVGVNETVLHVIGFIIVLVLVIFLLGILGRLIQKAFKMVSLGWLDRLLGIVFALAKAALVIGMLLILFDTLNAKLTLLSDEMISESVLYAPLRDLGYNIFPYLKALVFKQ